METLEMNKTEKSTLIGHLLGNLTVVILFFSWSFYLLSVTDFRWDRIKAAATERPEALVYLFIPLLLSLLWVPKVLKLLKDIKQKTVVEGIGTIHKSGRAFSTGFDRYIAMDAFGKEKIRIQYKDHWVLSPPLKIKYRIAPASRILTEFQLLTSEQV